VLDRARELYNAALTERRAAYEAHVKRHPGYYDDETRQRLTRELSADYYGQKRDKELRPEYQEIASHVLQDVILRVKMHREMEGEIKTLTVKREGEHWYCIFTCEVEAVPLAVSYEDVGIDLGVTHFAALSNGELIDHPRHFKHAVKKLASLQQAVSRKKKGSHRRARAVKILAKQHRKIRNQRKDFHLCFGEPYVWPMIIDYRHGAQKLLGRRTRIYGAIFTWRASVLSFGSVLPRYIVELVAIICTDLKSVFWTASAVETHIMRWKVTPVHWKG
jgi:transposase